MTFDYKTSTVTSFTADGKQIRKGNWSITDWKMGERIRPSADGSQANWAYGIFHVDAGSILWPFQINSHSAGHDATTLPTDFEIMQLDADHFKLIYPQTGTGSWTEATWWAFKKK